MSRKKKEQYRSRQQSAQSVPATSIPAASSTQLSSQDPAEVTRAIDFDSLEEKIRGDEVLLNEEHKKIKEEQEIKKALDKGEVDRRLENLRRQLGLKK